MERDRARGALLGSIVGDAFGAPLEGTSQADAASLVERRKRDRGPWRYTDDGAMTVAVAEAIVAANTAEVSHLFRHLSRHYEPARGFGRGMKMALSAFDSGVTWDQCALRAWPEGSRGNGGAVRIAPIAITSWPDRRCFERAVHLTTRVTHAHPEALLAVGPHRNRHRWPSIHRTRHLSNRCTDTWRACLPSPGATRHTRTSRATTAPKS
jgi:poly(ADP-ribose) glycohydrolase ARH3